MIKMIKILKQYLPLLAAALSILSCTRAENDPFSGKDSYIVSFTLRQGGVTFEAAIAGEQIAITAPEGFSLDKAKATVKLSENAEIYPNPDELTQWDDEQLFVVTARNGDQSTYKYTVKRSGLAHNGAVRLETQADVDAFGQRGITLIDGNLTIGLAYGADSITDLKPLVGLKEVAYTLTLQSTCAITTLEGLETLERVGDLLIGVGYQMLPLLETVSLPALKAVGSFTMQNTVTIIVDLPELEQVRGAFSLNCPLYQLQLPQLKTVGGNLAFTARSNASTSLAQIALPALEEVEGYLEIGYLKSVTKLDFPELKKLGGFRANGMTLLSFIYTPKLETTTGTMEFYNITNMTELNFPELKQAETLRFNNCKNITELNLPKLETVKSLYLSNIPVDGISGFTALKTADLIELATLSYTRLEIPVGLQHIGTLSINTNRDPQLQEINVKDRNIDHLNISGIQSKHKLIGNETFSGTLQLYLGGTDSLTIDIEGFHEVDSLSIGGSVSNLHLKNIRKIRKGVFLNCSVTVDFSMPNLEETGGNTAIYLQSMTNSTVDTIRFDRLKSVGGDFRLTIASKTVKVLDCPELTAVRGNLTLGDGYDLKQYYYDYRGLESMNFPKMTTVEGKLTIYPGVTYYKNAQLKNLDGFSSLTTVRSIDISLQTLLTDYSGLKKAFNTTTVPEFSSSDNGYNPSLQDLIDGKWSE
jgi:hypothetical protein